MIYYFIKPGLKHKLMIDMGYAREIVGFGEGLVGRLVMIDARAMRFETLRYARDPDNPLNGDRATIRDLSAHEPTH